MDFTILFLWMGLCAVKMLSRPSLIIADTNSLKPPHAGEQEKKEAGTQMKFVQSLSFEYKI